MNKKKALSIVLTKEELYVILVYIKAKKLVGLSDERHSNSILATAEKGLIARGYLRPAPDGKLKLISPLLASVGTCAFPETSILITRNTPAGVDQEFYFHTYRLMLVLHTIPMTDIHQFTVVDDKKMAFSAITSFLGYKKEKAEKYVPGVISIQDLSVIRDQAYEKNDTEAFRLLVKKGVTKKTAQAFAKSLTKPLTNTNVAYVAKSGDVTDGFTILESQDFLWLIEPFNNDYEQVSISVISSGEIYNRVKNFVDL